ncbi:hypothetical protein ACFQ3P_40210 [Paraburkholderia sabiae]|uniref:Uncharacterized protein n=1 Tax=Paraburkholderia sabiae TaxID=273251 RepID=A0ABU9QR76_9BURK|nr:hypothetical protein [Paraburkholderia sabiae]WJZ79378.1 hypothetical protein QEN71_41875 [Paraburkholderia sabiae]
MAQIDCEHVPDLPQWLFFRWLCDRARFRKRLPADNYAIFRTSLDAYDRNQLVLLTSAYGLPVTGAREAVVDAAGIKDPERSGNLVSKSGQIEPGDDYMVLDGRADQAIYRPIPLAIQELSLSALGGSLLHDTTFKPAAGRQKDLRRILHPAMAARDRPRPGHPGRGGVQGLSAALRSSRFPRETYGADVPGDIGRHQGAASSALLHTCGPAEDGLSGPSARHSKVGSGAASS